MAVPKGEGCLLWGGAWSGGLVLGGTCSGGVAWSWGCLVETPAPSRMATAAGGMHPTGMHSCLLTCMGRLCISVNG